MPLALLVVQKLVHQVWVTRKSGYMRNYAGYEGFGKEVFDFTASKKFGVLVGIRRIRSMAAWGSVGGTPLRRSIPIPGVAYTLSSSTAPVYLA